MVINKLLHNYHIVKRKYFNFLSSHLTTPNTIVKQNSELHVRLNRNLRVPFIVSHKRFFSIQNSNNSNNILDKYKINPVWPNPTELKSLNNEVQEKQINLV